MDENKVNREAGKKSMQQLEGEVAPGQESWRG